MPMPTFDVHLQGDAAVHRDGAPPLPLRGRAALLVAMVALEPGISRERAARMLWPDAPQPRQNLRQQLLRFRQALGRSLIEGDDLLRLADHVALVPPGADLLTAEEGGDDEAGEWLQQQRQRQSRALADTVREALASAEQAGDLDAALAHARALQAALPHDESAAAALMRVHYLRGDADAGLQVYERWCAPGPAQPAPRPAARLQELASALKRAQVPPGTQVPASRWPVTLRRPPQRVGRDAEWAQLQAAWQQGLAVLVVGEAGLGKTRLLTDWQAATPGAVLVGAGRPGDAGAPFATLTRLLRLADDEPAALGPDAARALAPLLPQTRSHDTVRPDALAAAVAALLKRRAVGTVVLDDLHFADGATLDLVAMLAADAGAAPRWLMAQRPAEAGITAARLVDTLTELRRLQVLRLQALDVQAVGRLVDDLGLPGLHTAELAGALQRHTGGNPLFVLETLKQALADGSLERGELPRPATVHALIDQRLQRLSEPALTLARVAAIAGVDFSVELAEAATGQRAVQLASAWQELQDAQVLRDEAFAHDLVADAVLRGLPQVVARRVHAQCAQWLQAQEGEPARVAWHWLHGGAPGHAGQAFVAAGQRARRAARTREEAELFGLAARAFDDAGQRDDAHAARCERGVALVHADFGDEAVHELQALRDDPAASGAQRLRAWCVLVDLLTERGHTEQVLLEADPALALARERGDNATQVRLACHLATALCRQGRAAEALQRLQPLRAWVDGQPDPDLQMLWHGDWAAALGHAGRLREALAAYDTALSAARRVGLADAEGRLEMNCAVTLRQAGYFDRALTLSRQGRERSRGDPGDTTHLHIAALVVARDECETGCYASALQALEAVLPAFEVERAVFWTQATRLVLAVLWLHLGQPARAVPLLRDDGGADLPAWLRADRQLLQLDLARVLQQRPDDAALQRALGWAAEDAQRGTALQVRALRHLPPAQALQQAQSLAADSRLDERLGVRAALHLQATRASLDSGNTARAEAEARALLALLDDGVAPDSCYRAEAWWLAHRALLAAGDAAAASQALQQGARWITQHALPHVPPAFIDSFLHRNAVNRDLLAALPR